MVESNALFATYNTQYSHVVRAMQCLGLKSRVIGPMRVSPDMLRRVANRRKLGRLTRLLERRVAQGAQPTEYVGLGHSQLIHPVAVRTGFLNPYWPNRYVTWQRGRKVRKHLGQPNLFHFVEGMGGMSLNRLSSTTVTVCEARNFHHDVFAVPLMPVGTFPALGGERYAEAEVVRQEHRQASVILVYSKAVKRSFVERGVDPSRVLVSPLGFHPDAAATSVFETWQQMRRQHQVCYIGRCNSFKGLDVASEAVRLLGQPWRLVVAGPANAKVKAWMAEQSHIEYLGIIDRERIRRTFSTSAALVMPSVESFGFVPLEAAACGLPVLLRETTGAGEYLYGANHPWVIHGRDPGDWATAIRKVAINGPELTTLRTAMKESAEALTWEHSAQCLAAIYESVTVRSGSAE